MILAIAILGLVASFMDFLGEYTVIRIIMHLSAITVFSGFFIIGKQYDIYLLKIFAPLAAFEKFVSGIVLEQLMPQFTPSEIVIILLLGLGGIVTIGLALSLFSLKQHVGQTALLLAIVYFTIGGLLVSAYVTAGQTLLFTALLGILARILELIILYKSREIA